MSEEWEKRKRRAWLEMLMHLCAGIALGAFIVLCAWVMHKSVAEQPRWELQYGRTK